MTVTWKTIVLLIAGFLALAVALPVLGWDPVWLAVAVLLIVLVLLVPPPG